MDMEAIFASEESALLGKDSTQTHYSHRTAETISTSGSYEGLEELFDPTPNRDEFPLSDESSSGGRKQRLGNHSAFENDSIFAIDASDKVDIDCQPYDGSFVGNVAEECYAVAEAALEELQEADEGENHYMETGLTRSCSILPSDVLDAAAVCQQVQKPEIPAEDFDTEAAFIESDVDEAAPVPLKAYILLASAVVSLSAIGPLLNLQEGTSPTMKIVWRQAATAMLLFPFAGYEIKKEGLPALTGPQWITFFLSAASYAVFSTCFVVALEFTSVGNDVILSNTMALLLLIGKLFVGDPVSPLEGMGAIVAFGGAALCSRDSASHNGTDNGFYGDALAILSAVGGVGYLIFAKSCRLHMPMKTFMFLTMVVADIMLITFQILVLGETVTFDRHVNHGVWGFLVMQPDRLPLEFAMAFVCNCMGTMGYVGSMRYFENIVISSATLLEPVVAEFLACLFGVGKLPGIQGWVGNSLVAGGTFAVICKDGKKNGSKRKDIP